MSTVAFDPGTVIGAAALLTALGIVSLVALQAWRDWIALKRDELAIRAATFTVPQAATGPETGWQIEIASLRERLRKLEAIAAGVDL